jgi:hypothetical protein
MNIERLIKFLNIMHSHPTACYIERNHHHSIGADLQELLDALLVNDKISKEEADKCLYSDSLWFCTYYPSNRPGRYESFGATFETVIDEVLKDIEAHEKVLN